MPAEAREASFGVLGRSCFSTRKGRPVDGLPYVAHEFALAQLHRLSNRSRAGYL